MRPGYPITEYVEIISHSQLLQSDYKYIRRRSFRASEGYQWKIKPDGPQLSGVEGNEVTSPEGAQTAVINEP